MGAMPNSYPGYQSVTDPAIRERFEKTWGVSLSPDAAWIITRWSMPFMPANSAHSIWRERI